MRCLQRGGEDCAVKVVGPLVREMKRNQAPVSDASIHEFAEKVRVRAKRAIFFAPVGFWACWPGQDSPRGCSWSGRGRCKLLPATHRQNSQIVLQSPCMFLSRTAHLSVILICIELLYLILLLGVLHSWPVAGAAAACPAWSLQRGPDLYFR